MKKCTLVYVIVQIVAVFIGLYCVSLARQGNLSVFAQVLVFLGFTGPCAMFTCMHALISKVSQPEIGDAGRIQRGRKV